MKIQAEHLLVYTLMPIAICRHADAVIKGTLVARKHFARTGRTTLKRQTHSYGSSTPQTASGSKTADRSWRAYSCRRCHNTTLRLKCSIIQLTYIQRLMGASLLVFKNKSDVPGCMTESEIREVRCAVAAPQLWWQQKHSLTRRCRDYIWMAFGRISGTSCPVLP